MRRNILIISLIVVLIAACVVPGCLNTGPGTAQITNVTTDKDLYHSKENMTITVLASAQGDMSNTTLRITGIKNKYNEFQLDDEIPVNLSPGTNIVTYEHKMPSCSSCSGLSAGTYQIDVALVHNGIIISNTTHSVELQQ